MRVISALAAVGAVRRAAFGALLALGLIGASGRASQALTINATFDNTLSSDAHNAINAAIGVDGDYFPVDLLLGGGFIAVPGGHRAAG